MDSLNAYTEPMQQLDLTCRHITIPDYIEPHDREQVNLLLNELASLDYRIVQLSDLQVIAGGPTQNWLTITPIYTRS